MHVRILRSTEGVVDSISLSRLIPGVTYELPFNVAMWLISTGHAEATTAEVDGEATAAEEDPLATEWLTGGVHITPSREAAADQPPRARKKRRL